MILFHVSMKAARVDMDRMSFLHASRNDRRLINAAGAPVDSSNLNPDRMKYTTCLPSGAGKPSARRCCFRRAQRRCMLLGNLSAMAATTFSSGME